MGLFYPMISAMAGGVLSSLLLASCISAAPQQTPAATEPVATPAPKVKVESLSPPLISAPVSNIRPHPGWPLTEFVTANFIGSGRCGKCHDLLQDDADNNMSIINHWLSTMMANAAKDPFWQAKVQSETARNPALKKVIEAKCMTCHMPMAWTQAKTRAKEYGTDMPEVSLDGFLDPGSELHEAAMDGVSCTLCHQIRDDGLGTKESFTGKYHIDIDKTGPERELFGPYREPVEWPMRTSVRFTPKFGPHTNDSALCATCHTLYTPYVDSEGRVAGEFPEQTAYLEWLHSDYGVVAEHRFDIGENPDGTGRLCQECHMPHSPTGNVIIAKYAPAQVKPKDHFSQHHFVGGNFFMVNLLQKNVGDLHLTAGTDKLEDTKIRTQKQLQENGAVLSLLDTKQSKGKLTTLVSVENKAGHKFPTGIPCRQTWLHFTVLDGNNEKIFESGGPRPDNGITGNDADEQPGTYEPHYQTIIAPDQVQIYETVMGNTDNAVTYTLLRAASFLKDNRLLPAGFDKTTAGTDIAVYGTAATDPDFVGGADRITYVVDIGGHPPPFRIEVELLYSGISYAFIKDFKDEAGLPLVRHFLKLDAQADKTPVVVATIKASVL